MVRPLTKRTMTLEELQERALDLCRQMRNQLVRSPYDEGLSDFEFIDEVISPLEIEIWQNRQVLRMNKDKAVD